jgi:hypothetical protein
MNRYFLGNCMAHANIIVDTADRDGGSRFFDDGTLAAETRREYTIADRLAVVELLNQRDVGAGCPKGWEEAAWARPARELRIAPKAVAQHLAALKAAVAQTEAA